MAVASERVSSRVSVVSLSRTIRQSGSLAQRRLCIQARVSTLRSAFSVAGRVIQREEKALAVEPNRPATVDMRLRVPETKEGVVFPAQLSLTLTGTDRAKAVASCEKRIWIFPEDAFATRKEWAKRLDIRLFDPEKKTAEVLTKAGVPFQPVANVDAIAEVKEGLLLVGECVSWKDYRNLGAMMVQAAVRGMAVLCLAPGGGEMAMPGMGEQPDAPKPSRVVLKGASVIGELDKRLDWEAWAGDGKVVARALKVVGERGPVTAVAGEAATGWPWLELGYAGGKDSSREGRLVICGFGVIEKWNSGPAPRYLLVAMMEYVSQTK